MPIGKVKRFLFARKTSRLKKGRLKSEKPVFDRKLFLLTIALTFIGLIAIAGASAPLAIRSFSDQFYFVKQQAVWAVVGILLMILVSRVNYKFWQKIATPLFLLSLATLVLVLIPGFGERISGARRWISFGPVFFQPAELVKLTLFIYLAKVASKKMKIIAYFVPVIICAGLIMLQPDLGTTLVVSAVSLVQIFVSGLSLLHFFTALFAGFVASTVLILTSDYRRERLLTFLKQTGDPLVEGYHIRQILLALGSGGFFGVGLGRSKQKYLFLPETATDSIFAVIAEEIGFFGASLLILIFLFYIIRGIAIARGAPDTFSMVLATGITAWVGIQAFLNIGSVVAVVPLTGIPLPFISYGGSALVTLLLATGILLNISCYAKEKRK